MPDERADSMLTLPEPDAVAIVQFGGGREAHGPLLASNDAPSIEPGQQVLDPVPQDAPRRRWLVEIAGKTYAPYYWNYARWTLGQPVERVPGQVASIDLLLCCEMYLAAGLERKILRVTPLGNGFSVGTMHKDEWHERGVFQDECMLSFGPIGPHPLRMGGNSPENTNGVASYVSTTAVEISGKLTGSAKDGKGGEVGAAYKISNSVSTSMRDFQVVNESSALDIGASTPAARWRWSMTQMGNQDAAYTYPYAGPHSLVTLLGANVCPLPALARGRLFPACQAWWFAPRDFQGEVEFRLEATQATSYVVTNPNPLAPYVGCIDPHLVATLKASPKISFDDSLWTVRP